MDNIIIIHAVKIVGLGTFCLPLLFFQQNIILFYLVYKMKSIVTVVLAFFLFFILSPGILLRVPRKGGKLVVAAVHAIVFSVIYSIIHYFLLKSKIIEGFPHDNPWLGYNNPLPQPSGNIPSWVQDRMNSLASGTLATTS